MELLLITRHAESEFNVRGLINSDPGRSCPLTPRGRRQAETLGQLLAAESIGLCVTSELERAIATADVVLANRTVPRLVMPDVNDPRAGDFEGGPASAHLEWLAANGLATRTPGGESQLDALARYISAYRELAARDERQVLMIAHGMPVAWLRSARRISASGADADPEANFGNSGVDFAARPDRVGGEELLAAAELLERFAHRSR